MAHSPSLASKIPLTYTTSSFLTEKRRTIRPSSRSSASCKGVSVSRKLLSWSAMGPADSASVPSAIVSGPALESLLCAASVKAVLPDEEESYLDQPIELDEFEDGGNDDQEATDLVVGEEIDVLGESIGDNEPIELDLGSIVGIDERLSEGE